MRTLILFAAALTACASMSKGPQDDKKKPPTFAELTKGQTAHPGFITLYEGPKGLYAVIPDALLGKDIGMMAIRRQGSGGLLLRGLPLDGQVARFDRVGHRVILSRINTNFYAQPNSPLRPAVDGNFANSPVFVGKLVKAKGQPAGNLIKLTDLFNSGLVDLVDHRLKYKAANPVISEVRVSKDNAVVRLKYRLTKQRGAPAKNLDTWTRIQEPKRLADGRNVEVNLDFHFFRLPDSDYMTRPADRRLGGFAMPQKDYSNLDEQSTSFAHHLVRWHVQPKDPTQAVSDAKKPIVFYMDKSIPPRWRPIVKEAAEWWNPAFEAAGIRGALEVREVPDDPDFDPHSLEHSMIFWSLTDDLMFSGMAGSAYTDPRTGQILKGHVYLNAEFPAFSLHRYLVYAWWRAPQAGQGEWHGFSEASPTAWKRHLNPDGSARCAFGPSYSSQLAFARLMLKVRGHLSTPEQERAFQEAAFKELVTHEVGHALGFHHNFKASLLAATEDVRTGKVTANPDDRPITGSVMDYNPVYIPPIGSKTDEYFIDGVGPYDRLMIEYAYRPLEHLSAQARAQRLEAIAAQAETAPGLAYDNGLLSSLDPTSNTDDLGRDPIAFSQERLTMIHKELLPKLVDLVMAETDDYTVVRQALDAVVFSVALDYVDILARHVGGQKLHRVLSRSGDRKTDPIDVIPAADQRRALNALLDGVIGPDAFPTPPKLLNTLEADLHYDWNYPYRFGTNYDVHKRLAFVYRALIGTLFTPSRLSKILDNESRVASRDKFTLAEMMRTVSDAVFKGLDRPARIDRRQRLAQLALSEMLIQLAVKKGKAPVAARQLAQQEIDRLRRRVKRAAARRISDPYVTAHLKALDRDLSRALEIKTVVMP